MSSIATAIHDAAGALQRIAERTSGERARRAAVFALTLRCAEQVAGAGDGAEFSLRRTRAELGALPSGAERSLLRRLLAAAAATSTAEREERMADALVRYAAELEKGRRLDEGDAVLLLARRLQPASAEVALHAARLARLRGDREAALELYRAARDLDDAGGSIARFAALGEAVISPQGERMLSRVIRTAILQQDPEVAAVALEERSLLRRARGARDAAARDLCFAAWRFTDAVDRARVAHRLADLFIGADDPAAAREALLLALSVGDATQKEHATARLHTVSRDLDDEVGQRRWRSFKRAPLVSLSGRPRRSPVESAAPRLAAWREAIEAALPLGI